MSKRFYILFGLIALANVGLLIDSFVKSSEIDSLFTLNRQLREKVDELTARDDRLYNDDLLVLNRVDDVDGRLGRLFALVQSMNSERHRELQIQTILARLKTD